MKTASTTRGFTLIELMITVTIVSVLLAIAIPTYQTSIRKSRRVEARTAVLDAAAREQRYYSVNQAFTNAQGALGYAAAATTTAVSGVSVGSGYYTITIPNIAAPAANAPATFSVTATAVGSQLKDTACQTFTVTSTGQQTATNSGGADATAVCWK
jgi:type IV pilus assembly protein PilE